MSKAWPIIIGGMPRSGTSLVRRIMNGHSAIHCGPEVKFLDDFFGNYIDDPLKNIRFFSTLSTIVEKEAVLSEVGAAFVRLHERAAQAHGKARWADKNPSNAIYIESWERVLRNGFVFVHVVRNPLDTIASLKKMQFDRTIPRRISEKAKLYSLYYRAPMSFAERYPNRYVRVVYEELTEDPKGSLGSLMRAVGEEPEDEQLAIGADHHGSGIEDPGIATRATIESPGRGRWREILTRKEADTVWELTKDVWEKVDPRSCHVEPPTALLGRWRDAARSRRPVPWWRGE